MVYLSFYLRDLLPLSATRWASHFRKIHFTTKNMRVENKKKAIFAIKDSSSMQSRSCCIKICDLKKFIQCYWLFILCLVCIKFPSFVNCAVSLQRNCKFSAFWADSWIPCLSVQSNQTEPAPFWPLAGSLAGASRLTWVTREIPSISPFDLPFTRQYFLFLLICLLSC